MFVTKTVQENDPFTYLLWKQYATLLVQHLEWNAYTHPTKILPGVSEENVFTTTRIAAVTIIFGYL